MFSATLSSDLDARPSNGPEDITACIVSIDLEVGRDSGRIHRLAGVHGRDNRSVAYPPGTLPDALRALDSLADSATYVLGHNLIAFDLPQLRAAQPNLRLLGKDAIDTLRLNPLAFPASMRCVTAQVRAVLIWRKCDSAPEYQARCRSESWEVVMPELVFER